MKINIKTHFDEEKKTHQELVAKAITERKKLQSDIVLKSAAQEIFAQDLQKKKNLLRENEAEGLDTAKLKDKIQELEPQIAKATKEIALLKEAMQQLGGVLQRSFEREDLMTSVLKDVSHCEEAVVVESWEDVLALLPVVVTELDGAGRPTKCEIQISSKVAKQLSIRPGGNYFAKNFRPKALDWLPIQKQEPEAQSQRFDHKELVCAFYDKGTGKFILSHTTVEWSVTGKVQNHGYGRQDEYYTQNFKEDFSDIAISLGAKMEALLQDEKAELDLEKAYKDNPLMAHARSAVAALTTEAPLFKESNEHLTSEDIYQRIKLDWDAFKSCPWSAAVSGALALLKYHVENGERARFWSGIFEGQFGYRLRTRDHTWIVGELYVDFSAKPATSKTPLKIHETGRSAVSLGRLALRVGQER